MSTDPNEVHTTMTPAGDSPLSHWYVPHRNTRSPAAGATGLMSASLVVPPEIALRLLAGNATCHVRRAPTAVRGRIGITDTSVGATVGEATVLGCIGPIEPDDARLYAPRTIYTIAELIALAATEAIWLWVLSDLSAYTDPIPNRRRAGSSSWTWTHLPKTAPTYRSVVTLDPRAVRSFASASDAEGRHVRTA
jgi:hypothetical protein